MSFPVGKRIGRWRFISSSPLQSLRFEEEEEEKRTSRRRRRRKKRRQGRERRGYTNKDDESIACQDTVGFFLLFLSPSKDIITTYKFIHSVFLYLRTHRLHVARERNHRRHWDRPLSSRFVELSQESTSYVNHIDSFQTIYAQSSSGAMLIYAVDVEQASLSSKVSASDYFVNTLIMNNG